MDTPEEGGRFWRQLDLFDPSKLNTTVHLIGVGGIGSPTAAALVKMGVPKLVLWDGDTVEEHNLPNQFYREGDLTRHKVDALRELCLLYHSNCKIEVHQEHYTPDQLLEGVVISGVDSMAARKQIWEGVRYNGCITAYIEARMGAEFAAIHTIDPVVDADIEWYEGRLYDDGEAVSEPCTARAIIYNTFMIAALVSNQLKKVVMKEGHPRELLFDLKGYNLMTSPFTVQTATPAAVPAAA